MLIIIKRFYDKCNVVIARFQSSEYYKVNKNVNNHNIYITTSQ